MAINLKAVKSPSDSLSLTNCFIVNPHDFPDEGVKHVKVRGTGHQSYIYSLLRTTDVKPGTLGVSLVQRKWTSIALNQVTEVLAHKFPANSNLNSITVEADFLQKSRVTQEPYDTDKMSEVFIDLFNDKAFSVGQPLVFSYGEKKYLQLVVRHMDDEEEDGEQYYYGSGLEYTTYGDYDYNYGESIEQDVEDYEADISERPGVDDDLEHMDTKERFQAGGVAADKALNTPTPLPALGLPPPLPSSTPPRRPFPSPFHNVPLSEKDEEKNKKTKIKKSSKTKKKAT